MADFTLIELAERPRVRLPGRSELSVFAFLRRLDWVLAVATIGLVGYGLWVVAGITRFDVPGDESYYVTRQAIAVGIGLVGLVAAAVIPLDFARRQWRLVYGVTLALMILVFFLAETIRGSKRWIDLGFFQFQPSELGKVLFVVAIAGFLVERAGRLQRWRTIMQAIGLGLGPILLVFLQPDLGTALVYSAALFALLFFVGVRWRKLLTLVGVGLLAIVAVLWLLPAAGVGVLKPYQTERITGLFDRDRDPGGLNWNANQSITAVGSGELTGRGVLDASQTRLDYLPEHATDFAFASLAEQRGFVGSAILLLLYLLVVWRGLRVITVAGDLYSAIVAGALVFAFVFQVFVNVGMTMGVAPVTGIPLPFVTVGGSSLVTSLVLIGVLQGIHARGLLSGRSPA
jgi:rod shape determining protein RodA